MSEAHSAHDRTLAAVAADNRSSALFSLAAR